MFGTLGGTPVLGLPGNPVSSMVCALLFLGPALDRMLGLPVIGVPLVRARLGSDVRPNNFREDYMRATFATGEDGALIATPLPIQDSSMMSALARSDGLIIRPPDAPAAAKGAWTDVIPLGDIRGA
jgi:molybdopterin molybdotransferase